MTDIKAKPFIYDGIEVSPTYISASGTGRKCQTVQGWTFPSWDSSRGEHWCASKRKAREQIDYQRGFLKKRCDELGSAGAGFLRYLVKQWPDEADQVRLALKQLAFDERPHQKKRRDIHAAVKSALQSRAQLDRAEAKLARLADCVVDLDLAGDVSGGVSLEDAVDLALRSLQEATGLSHCDQCLVALDDELDGPTAETCARCEAEFVHDFEAEPDADFSRAGKRVI